MKTRALAMHLLANKISQYNPFTDISVSLAVMKTLILPNKEKDVYLCLHLHHKVSFFS